MRTARFRSDEVARFIAERGGVLTIAVKTILVG